MTDHLGELAALYALGILERAEQRNADEHLTHCEACRRLLAQAEADVAAMAAAQPQLEPPAALRAPQTQTRRLPQTGVWLAVAAAVVIAVLPSGYLLEQNLAMHQTELADAQVMSRLASGPHRTAAFAGTDAQVMYAPDGSWYCIIIRGATAPLHVMWPHDGTQTMLGTAMPHGDIALLYLPKSHRMDQLSLMKDGQVVGQALLVF